ncbi:MAG: hypothetical protein MUP49_02205 [Dehalococcoidia bacterium]|nr:hypothetical protein [Dehalococcoidia bacterium]
MQTNSTPHKGGMSILSPDAIEQGFGTREDGDHVLELLKDGKVIAQFSQSGGTVDNILKEIESGKYQN